MRKSDGVPDGWIHFDACPLCGSANIEQAKLHLQPTNRAIEIVPGVAAPLVFPLRYDRCGGCRIIFQNPRLDDAALNEFYSSGAYRQFTGWSIARSRKMDMAKAQATAAIIKAIFPDDIASHLDYGCGPGYILGMVGAAIRHGIDRRPEDCQTENVSIFSVLSDELKHDFELVSILHVLEHVSHPLELLKQLYDHTAPGGTLVVEVPAVRSAFGLPHIFWYSVDVLEKLVAQAGFTVVKFYLTPHTVAVARKG